MNTPLPSPPNMEPWRDFALKALYKLVGTAHGKFAATSIAAGTLLAGVSWWQAVLVAMGFPADASDWMGKALGAFLIISGVIVFATFEWRATNKSEAVNTPGFAIFIPEGRLTFAEAVDILGNSNQVNIVLDESFTPQHRAIILKQKHLGCETLPDLLRQLQVLGGSAPLPRYEVVESGGHFTLRVTQ